MKTVFTVSEMKTLVREWKREKQSIALVPTMGALHEGHLALMRTGKQKADLLIASIFVNPTQFNDPADYEKYPRTLEADLEQCLSVGVDVVFLPAREEIYGRQHGFREEVPIPVVARKLEGVFRPGHFEGVVAIVSRLFQCVEPDTAIFGLKDYQQFCVIREMVREQGYSVDVIGHPLVREPDGLAMSSRNQRLGTSGRKKAEILFRALQRALSLFEGGERRAVFLQEEVKKMIGQETVTVEYVALVNPLSLEPVSEVSSGVVLLLAVFVEGVRLIDYGVFQ